MSQDDPENQAITENQPAAQRSAPALERSRSVEVVSTSTSWRAPLPPPAVLRQYEGVLPGSAERIMRMMEERASHRFQAENRRIQIEADRVQVERDRVQVEADRVQVERDRVQIEKGSVEAGSKRAYLGLASGFIISLIMIAIGAYAIIWVNTWLGVAVIAAQNAVFASLFVYVANSRRRERERKAADADAGRG